MHTESGRPLRRGAADWMQLGARLLLGGIFVYASLDKIAHPAAFAKDVYNYQILPDVLVHLVALALPWMELFLGLCLITGFWLPGAVLSANGLLLVFVGALAFNAARGLDVHCGCFSTGSEGPALATHWVLLRDGLFLAVALVLFYSVFFARRAAGKTAPLLLAIFWLSAGGSGVAEAGSPAVVVPKPHHDFGTAIEGDLVRHEFVVENRGTAELRIEKLKTGCGCTAASSTRLIPAGGQGTIRVEFKTAGYAGRDIREAVVVHTNDPAAAVLELMLSGRVEAFADIQPKSVLLRAKAGETASAVARILPRPERPFAIRNLRAVKGRDIRFQLAQKSGPSGTVYELTIFSTRKEPGRIADMVVIETDHPARPALQVMVTGVVE